MPRIRCPVDPLEKAWIEYRLQWCSHVFGAQALRKAHVVTPRDVGIGKSLEFHDLPRAFDEVQRIAFPAKKPLRLSLGDQAIQFQRPESDESYIHFQVNPDQSASQTFAGLLIELCHRRLVESGAIQQGDRSELLSELATVFFGIAIIPANECVGRTWATGASMEIIPLPVKRGHLTGRMFGYAIAAWVTAKQVTDQRWFKELCPDVREATRKSIDYLHSEPAPYFSSETIGNNPDAATKREILDLIGSASTSKIIVGLWQLAGLERISEREFEQVVPLLEHPVPEIRSAAAESISLADSASPAIIEALVRSLGDRYEQVRAGAARTLGFLRPQDERIVDQIQRLLHDADRDVAFSAGWALGRFGSIAQAAIPSLIKLLRRSLIECEHQAIDTIVGSLDSISVEFEALIPEIVDRDENELYSLVHDALVRHRQVD